MGILATTLGVIAVLTVSDHAKERITGLIGTKYYSSLSQAGSFLDAEDVDKLDEIYHLIDEMYYFEDRTSYQEMKDGMYAGILASLDDEYSCYYTAEELNTIFEESTGNYSGIGSYVTMDTERGLAFLSGVFEGSPAEEAGLRDGDYIIAVDDVEVYGMTLDEIVSLIKGEKKTQVKIQILRGDETLEIMVTRDEISVPTVSYEMKDNQIGYIQIKEFDDVTTNQFKEAYTDLQNQNMTSLILDLRSNPGGNLTTVVEVCEMILPEGIITYTEDKYGNREDIVGKGKNPIQIPMVVLVNGYSASASELMTGAIRDYGVGTIIGTNTFGKGIVQTLMPLDDGSGIKITTSNFHTPGGECFHGYGIAPDIEVEFDSELYYGDEQRDNQLEYAIEYLSK